MRDSMSLAKSLLSHKQKTKVLLQKQNWQQSKFFYLRLWINCCPFSLLTSSTSPEIFALSCDQACLSTWKSHTTFTPWHSMATWSNMAVTEVIWMSDLIGTVLVRPDMHPPHKGYTCALAMWWSMATASSPCTSVKSCIAQLHWKMLLLQYRNCVFLRIWALPNTK